MDRDTRSSSDLADFSEVNSTPLDLDDLFDVQKELIQVSAKWRSIGIALRLKPNTLDVIETRYSGDPPACLTPMVTEWLNRNYNVKRFGEPTWQALVKAVGDLAGGANMALATDMATRHKAGGPPLPFSNHPSPPRKLPAVSYSHSAATTHDRSKAVVFAHENRQTITAKFADFQTKVCNKLFQKEINTEEFRLFVTNQFPPGDCIPPPPAGLMEVFKAITHHGLWDYFHYSPLVQIAKKFCANDPEIESWVQTYMKDLKAYSLVTTVAEHIETDLEIAVSSTRRAKYDPHYYTPMEWKTNFVDHSLQYLAEVWEFFSSHYLVPDSPPTALLDRVRWGCFSVTWLVPSGLLPQLIKRVQLDSEFFKRYCILKVTVGNKCIYKQIAEESTSENPRKESAADQTTCNYGGYDCEFVSPPPEFLETECSICLLVPHKPMQTSCGHIFCESCIERHQKQKKSCPKCKEELSTYYDKGLQHLLNELQVKCPQQKAGCDWTGELRELDRHLSIWCEFSNTSADVPPILKKQPNHLPDKQDKQIREAKMQPSMDGKQQTQEFSLNVLPSHPKSNFLVDHHFTMTKFELHKRNNAEWNSPPFHTHEHGYKMCVRIDANGYDEERGNYLSLYTCFMKGDYDNYLQWPFQGEIAVELLNQNADEWGEGGHHKCTIRYDDSTHDCAQRVDFEEKSRGVGKPKFISHSELNPKYNSKVQYLRNDCLKFRLSILHVELPELYCSGKLIECEPVDFPSSITS